LRVAVACLYGGAELKERYGRKTWNEEQTLCLVSEARSNGVVQLREGEREQEGGPEEKNNSTPNNLLSNPGEV